MRNQYLWLTLYGVFFVLNVVGAIRSLRYGNMGMFALDAALAGLMAYFFLQAWQRR